ncbi:hypothetical protein ACHAWC_004401, partial [Mediolabrus comicus]
TRILQQQQQQKQWRLYAQNDSTEYLASLLLAEEEENDGDADDDVKAATTLAGATTVDAATNNNNEQNGQQQTAAAAEDDNDNDGAESQSSSSLSSEDDINGDQAEFMTNLITNETISENTVVDDDNNNDDVSLEQDKDTTEKEEVVIVVDDDDDYESSMLPVPEDITNTISTDEESLGGGNAEDELSSEVTNIVINGDSEETTTVVVVHPNEEQPSLIADEEEVDSNLVASSISSDGSDEGGGSIVVDSSANNSDNDEGNNNSNNRATRSLLNDGESPITTDDTKPSSSTAAAVVGGYLRRKLLSRISSRDDGIDGEQQVMTKEERRQKWTTWMTSGRKNYDYDASSNSNGGSGDTSSSSSGSGDGNDGTNVSLDESLLNINKGEDYVVVAVPAEAVGDNNVGVKLSSFPGGKLFQKTVANMQRELNLENRNNMTTTTTSSSTTMGGGGGSDDSVGSSNKQEQQEERKKQKERQRRKKNEQESESKQLEKQMKVRQQQINLEQRTREKGRVTANDWRHNMGNVFASTILRDVRNPVLCVFTWATIWSILYKTLSKVASGSIVLSSSKTSEAIIIPCAKWFIRHASLPSLPHTMMVSAMSLLLVFRTNSAYQRFAEGRKIWNDIVDTSRDFSRLIKLYEFAIGTSKVRRINNLLASFPYLLRHRIRPSLMSMRRVNDPEYERDPENSLLLYPDASLRDTDPDVAALAYDGEEAGKPSRRMKRELCWVDKRTLPWKLLPGTALELCARAQNRPLWVCDRMAKELSVVDDVLPKWTNRERLALIGYVDKLSRSIGACERIHQTVVPLNYARHALRSLTVWLWTLPFVLVKDLGLLTGPVVAVLSWILFGVYEIGSRIEDPFQGTLRLSIYCDAIRRDVLTDAIARDTAFELEDETKVSVDDEGDEDAIFELDSESEEYGGDDIPLKKRKKKKNDYDFLERIKKSLE